jgi:hypothetical protein
MTLPAEPHNKYILLNGEANIPPKAGQACGKPYVVDSTFNFSQGAFKRDQLPSK